MSKSNGLSISCELFLPKSLSVSKWHFNWRVTTWNAGGKRFFSDFALPPISFYLKACNHSQKIKFIDCKYRSKNPWSGIFCPKRGMFYITRGTYTTGKRGPNGKHSMSLRICLWDFFILFINPSLVLLHSPLFSFAICAYAMPQTMYMTLMLQIDEYFSHLYSSTAQTGQIIRKISNILWDKYCWLWNRTFFCT